MPRGSFKSSVTTVGYSLFSLARDPNMRILIAGETQKNAKKFLAEIKTHIEHNQKFQAIFGNWKSRENIWREDEILINKRTKVKKEPSIMAASLERQSTTGMHYDLIILDDPVSMSNINTPEQLQKTIDFYKMLLSVLDPGKELVIIGTRYSALDLYGHILDEDGADHEKFSIMCKEAIDADGELLFPEVLSHEFLEEQRSSQGAYMFTCQYLNKAVSPDTCYFAPECVQFFEKEPPGCYYFITIDPAISLGARSDFTGIIVNAVDYKSHWYIVEALAIKLKPDQLIDKIFEIVEKYDPVMAVGMEKFSLEQVLKVSILAEALKRNVAIPLVDVPTDNRISKDARIRALQPKFMKKEIFIKKDQKALHHQILYYPKGVKNDDVIDALKSQLAITYPSSHIYDEQEQKTRECEDKLSQKAWDMMRKHTSRKVRSSSY